MSKSKSVLLEDFHILRKGALASANRLCEEKSGAYSHSTDIRSYWEGPHGLKFITYEIRKRALRLASLVDCPTVPASSVDKLEDCALDLINYAAFLYAEINLRTQENQNGNKTTESDAHKLDAKTSGNPCVGL